MTECDAAICVLVVEDSPVDRRLLQKLLEPDETECFRLTAVDRLSRAIEAARGTAFDVALLDLALPDSQGLVTVQRMHEAVPDLPLVVLTGFDDERVGVASLRKGAQDYLLKDDLRPALLRRAVRYAIERQRVLDRLQQSQEALKAQQQFLRSIVDANPNPIGVKDAAGRYTLANLALARFYGTTPDRLVGETDARFNPYPAQVERIRRQEAEILATRQEQAIAQEPLRNAQGELRWFQTIRKPLLTPDGQVCHILEVSADITERQMAEQLLWQQAEREQLLGQIAEQIHRSLDLPQIATAAATQIRPLLEADLVALYRQDADAPGSVALEAADVREAALPAPAARGQWLGPLLQSSLRWRDRALVAEDLEGLDLSPETRAGLSALQARALLVAPIVRGELLAEQGDSAGLPGGRDASTATAAGDRPTLASLWGVLVVSQGEPRSWEAWEIRLVTHLSAQLAIAIQQSDLYRQLKTANATLKQLASLDGLTGIPNRRQFDEVLQREWHRLARKQQPLAAIMVDIDCFKAYNDRYGHLAGDDCLQQVARAVARAARRGSDYAFRYGGEEFVLLLADADADGAAVVAEEILQAVRALNLAHEASTVADRVTASLGVADRLPDPQQPPATLIQAADRALFRAKTEGRNRWVRADAAAPPPEPPAPSS